MIYSAASFEEVFVFIQSNVEQGHHSNVEKGHDSNVEKGHDSNVENGLASSVEKGNDSNVEKGCNSSVKKGCNSSVEKGNDSNVKKGCNSSVKKGYDMGAEKGHDSEEFCKLASKAVWGAIGALLQLLDRISGVLVDGAMRCYLRGDGDCGEFVTRLAAIGESCLSCIFR